MSENSPHAKNPNTGHRERLRQRFREHGLENFQDYEALELLLLYVARQMDMKPVAKRLIERFGSFQGAIDASPEDLLEVEGVGESAVTLIHFVKQAAARYLAQGSRLKATPEDIRALIDYCRLRMGALPDEQFRIFGLNASFAVVGEDLIAEGTIDQSMVYPRKVIEAAIKHGATTLIFVHNHPGGECSPSEIDKTITRSLLLAARAVNITVFDHLIVSTSGYYSFRENGLL